MRARYIAPAKVAGYSVIAYHFEADIKECLRRNAERTGKARVHPAGIYTVRKRMQTPSLEEGFDAIFEVRPEENFRITLTAGHYPPHEGLFFLSGPKAAL
jgi:hypothetical protein